jgi:hypothetical protein
MIREDKILYTLAFLAACLSLFLLSGLVIKGEETAKKDSGAVTDLKLPGFEKTSGDAGRYKEIDRHTIFSPERKLPLSANATIVPNGKSATPLPFTLVGIVTSGLQKTIVIKHAGDKEVTSVPQGQTIDGWRVDDIAPNQAIVSSSDERRSLSLPEEQGQHRP